MAERELKHIVGLSGGKDSVAMALLLREQFPDRDFDWVCTPTGRELPPMFAHWERLGHLLGKPLRPVPAKHSLAGLVYIQKALPNWRMRWCTRMLKIEPFEEHVMANLPCVVYVGMRADEVGGREGVDWQSIDGVTRSYPLVEAGWGLSHVYAQLDKYGVIIPDRTDCDMCFFQTLWEWFCFWRDYPDSYWQVVGWEDFTGHTLRSAQRDSWPASLRELAACFAAGRIPKQRQTMKDRKVMCSTCAR
jgi:hypothetical protein